jgi:hypothetical protein
MTTIETRIAIFSSIHTSRSTFAERFRAFRGLSLGVIEALWNSI